MRQVDPGEPSPVRGRLTAAAGLLTFLLTAFVVHADAKKTVEKAGGTVRVNDDKAVSTVIMWGPGFQPATLKELKEFGNLQKLRIGGPWITDDAVKDLHALKNLQLLEIRSPKVSDAALKELQKALPKLKITRAARDSGEIK